VRLFDDVSVTESVLASAAVGRAIAPSGEAVFVAALAVALGVSRRAVFLAGISVVAMRDYRETAAQSFLYSLPHFDCPTSIAVVRLIYQDSVRFAALRNIVNIIGFRFWTIADSSQSPSEWKEASASSVGRSMVISVVLYSENSRSVNKQ
jgi:hypothetical protein